MVKVSAMMLTHNRKNWLREAIKSVLNQTFKDFELIIIDNASTDGTEEAVKYFDDERIVYIRNKENIYPGALNQMVDLAKGEYIAICDDDDLSLPERFEKCVGFLDANPDVAMVYGDIKRIKQVLDNEIEHDIKYSIDPTFKNIYESDGVIDNPTVMIRKKVIKEVGGYDDNFFIASDYDLSLRIAHKYKIAHLDYFLAKYRVHDDNLSLKNIELTVKYRWRALLKWAKVSCLCFSCNRVFQLENYIRSFFRFVNSMKINEKGLFSFSNGGIQLNVLYKNKYKKGYEELIKKYPEVNFIEEHDFKEQVLNWLKNAPDFVMFGCDDVIFKDYVNIEKIMEKLKLPDTIGFSLRLGKGLTYCFPIDKFIKEPEYEESEGILKWRWANAEGDYGYPFEVAASVYKKEFVKKIINYLDAIGIDWSHPNLLEGRCANLVKNWHDIPKDLCAFSKPKALCIQINRVQDVSLNRFFDIGYDVETLFNLWEKGKKLNLDYYKKDFNSIYVKDFVLEGEEKVSVIIPVYNQKPEYFEECIQSVVNQTRKPYEIIVIDDGSEPSQSIILPDSRGIEIKLIRNKKNMGVGFSRQRGVDEATGDYITFLSSDDVWDKRFLEVMVKTAEQYPEKILYSHYYRINEKGQIINKYTPSSYEDHEDFCIACFDCADRNVMFVNFSTTFFPKQVFHKIKFDKELRFGEDLDFLLKSMKHFQYHLVPQYLLKYRNVDNLTSKIRHKIPENNDKIIKNVRKYWENV